MADLFTRITQKLSPIFKIKQNVFHFFQRDYRHKKPSPFLPHIAFAFTMFVQLGFLQVKYQGKNQSPFESNPTVTSLAVVSLLLYCFAFAVEQKTSSSSRWSHAGVGWCMSVAGSLSAAATASLLFPDFVRPVLFGLAFVIVAAERIHWVYIRVCREQTRSEKVVRRCRELFTDISRPLAQYFTDHHRRQMLPKCSLYNDNEF